MIDIDELKKVRTALRFYANPRNWEEDDWGIRAVCVEYGSSGGKARDALARLEAFIAAHETAEGAE